MGLNNSKPKKPPETKAKETPEGRDLLNFVNFNNKIKYLELANQVLLFSNGDKYEGHVKDNDING